MVKALAKKPEDRYQTVGAMTADLKSAVGLAAEVTPIDTMPARRGDSPDGHGHGDTRSHCSVAE